MSVPRPSPRLGAAALLLVVALTLVPSLRAERRLERAEETLPRDPVAAIRTAQQAENAVTFERSRVVQIEGLSLRGDHRAAERLALATERVVPEDPIVQRWIYASRLEQHRRRAAAGTLDRLARRDPMWVLGLGR